jgi:type IV secretory pathway VirB9-like protein
LRQLIIIHPTEQSISTCIVITTNKTREDLQKASDKNLIKKFQEALGTKERPKWYLVADE